MGAILLDTLKMVETLRAGGFSDQQARAMTRALSDAASVAAVATRGDVMDLGVGVKHDFDTFKIEMRADFEAFKTEMRGIEQRMTIRLGGMLVVLAGVLSAVFHYLR